MVVFISALCHDLDHPGNNNMFETKTNSWLSKRYSDDATLERHSLNITLALLDHDETNIWSGMTKNDRTIFRHQLRKAIISTDMAYHKHIVDNMVMTYDANDIESRRTLCNHIIHCADLSAQTQSVHLARKWGLLINEEFKEQAKKEVLLHLDLTDIMQNLDDMKITKQQANFISNVIQPLWQSFVSNLPSLSFVMDRIQKNLDDNLERVKRLKNEKQ